MQIFHKYSDNDNVTEAHKYRKYRKLFARVLARLLLIPFRRARFPRESIRKA